MPAFPAHVAWIRARAIELLDGGARQRLTDAMHMAAAVNHDDGEPMGTGGDAEEHAAGASDGGFDAQAADAASIGDPPDAVMEEEEDHADDDDGGDGDGEGDGATVYTGAGGLHSQHAQPSPAQTRRLGMHMLELQLQCSSLWRCSPAKSGLL